MALSQDQQKHIAQSLSIINQNKQLIEQSFGILTTLRQNTDQLNKKFEQIELKVEKMNQLSKASTVQLQQLLQSSELDSYSVKANQIGFSAQQWNETLEQINQRVSILEGKGVALNIMQLENIQQQISFRIKENQTLYRQITCDE